MGQIVHIVRSLFDGEIVQSYINFATQDGTANDFGSYLLLYGPVAISLLLLVIVYQFGAMFVTGLWRTGKALVGAGRAVAGRTSTAPAVVIEAPVVVAVPAPVAVAAVPAPAEAPAAAGVALPVQPAAVGIKRTPARVA